MIKMFMIYENSFYSFTVFVYHSAKIQKKIDIAKYFKAF